MIYNYFKYYYLQKTFLRVLKCLFDSLLTDDISEGHDVILGERESFYLGQLPGLVDMGDHLSQVLGGGGCNGNEY